MNQKGLVPILVLLVVVLLVGFVVYQKQTTSSTPQLTNQTPPSDETTNLKTFKFTDSSGFGYEIELSSEWSSSPYISVMTPVLNPKELAQNFINEDCTKDGGEVYVFHFMSDKPQSIIPQDAVMVKNNNNISIYKSKNINSAFIISTKGYYKIETKDTCSPSMVGKAFDQILSTFKFVDNKTVNWKTHNLSKFGVEFKLDPGYAILEDKTDLVSFYWINLGKEARIWVSNELTKHPEVKCSQFDRPVDYNQNDFKTLCISDIEERVIDGVKVKVFSIHGGADYNYSYLQSENPQVELKMYTSGGGAVKNFESIISTFKFTQ